jgi:G3E family GTPase
MIMVFIMHDGLVSTQSPAPVPVLTVCSLDPVLRASAVAALLCDAPAALVVQYDLGPHDGGGTGADDALRRTVFTSTGVRESGPVDPGHGCLTCALTADLLEVAARLVAHAPGLVVLALPVALEPSPVVRALRQVAGLVRPAGVVTVTDQAGFESDLLGDATVAERGFAVAEDDERGVGKVLAHLVEYSDAVLTPGALTARGSRLLEHLGRPGLRIRGGLLHEVDPWALASIERPADDPRGELQQVRAPGVQDGEGVWTLALTADRPVHPDRLLERIEDLGSGRTRSRGFFWLASRPELACAWDGAGGQLSIGSLGPWTRPPARTQIVVTGTEPGDRHRIAGAFADVVLTPAEQARGSAWWRARGDTLGPWLGDLDPAELTG